MSVLPVTVSSNSKTATYFPLLVQLVSVPPVGDGSQFVLLPSHVAVTPLPPSVPPVTSIAAYRLRGWSPRRWTRWEYY